MSKDISLDFMLPVQEVERDGRSYRLEASEAELAALAERFNLIEFGSLKADIEVKDRGAEQGIFVTGTLDAAFTQRCIVSLEPVAEEMSTSFELMLVDEATADRMDAEEVYLDDDAPEYDALEGDMIPLGEIVAQTVSINMNPYPRAEDAELNVGNKKNISVNEEELKKPNPFAVLDKLRKES
ncbi:YceD family protein [Kordiimonas gwangyangensis]|uniref:YceD family protein n=1 Tax=Kordiimonas gwangyangensis TaxID=288022 RepID=UPI0003628EE4|nr:YceD family protein [Kordiimonas gwangyangensis]